jgi:hypothetical protein
MKDRIKYIILVVIIIILIASVGLNIMQHFSSKKRLERIAQYEIVIDNVKKYMKERDEKIAELEKIKTKTVIEFVQLPCEKKDDEYKKLNEKYIELEKISKGDKKQLEALSTSLNDCKKLKDTLLDFGINFHAMIGVGGLKKYVENNLNPVDINLTIGIDYIKYFFDNRLGLMIGGYVTPLQDIEVGINLGMIINFKKKT